MTSTTPTKPTTEHCGNCANTRSDTSHTVCTASRDVGTMNYRPRTVRCVCSFVADSTKPRNCPGWVAAWKAVAR